MPRPFCPGDIILVEHRPTNDPTHWKSRPALIISGSIFHQASLDVIIAPISSNIRLNNPWQVVINETSSFFASAQLKVTSAIQCSSILAYPKCQIRKRLGSLPVEVLSQVRNIIIDIINKD